MSKSKSEVKRLSMYEPNYRCYEYIEPIMVEDTNGDYVEYSAYLELQKKCEELEVKLESAREVIGFYASSDNWNHVSQKEATYSVIDKEDLGVGEFQLNSMTDDDRVGGLKARKWTEEDKK